MERFGSLVVFSTVLAVYVWTAYPSVSGGDSGELIITACNWGTAHPPGYPLYTMLGRLAITIIPFGHMAWRVGMFCAVCGSLAAAFIYATVTRLTRGSFWAGLLSAFGFAFSPTVWLYSIQGEVFGLNNCLCAAIAYLTVLFFTVDQKERDTRATGELSASPTSGTKLKVWLEEHGLLEFAQQFSAEGVKTPQDLLLLTESDLKDMTEKLKIGIIVRRKLMIALQALNRAGASKGSLFWACVGAFVCGLAMTNQHTTVFCVAPTVLWVVYALASNKKLSGKAVLLLTVSLLAGLSPYLYLPISAHYKRMDSWGDQRTIAGFMHHFLRREYGTFQLAGDGTTEDPGMIPRLQFYFQTLWQESTYLPVLLAPLGLLAGLLSRSGPVSRSHQVFLANYVLYTGVFHKLANLALEPLFLGVQMRFWMQSNLHVYIWAGAGLHTTATFLFTSLDLRNQEQEQEEEQKKEEEVPTKGRKEPNKEPKKQGRSRKAVFLSSCIVVLVAVGYSSLQCWRHFFKQNHRGNEAFFKHGAAILRSFPPNALVLLNGDLNNNAVKYPQQCEGVRPDLRLVSLQLMSWDWFVEMQAANYPGVKFPGSSYHPRKQGSFSIRKFLNKNYKRFPIFLCGPWKEGDLTYQGRYTTRPFGHCAQVVQLKDEVPKNWTKVLAAGNSNLIPSSQLGGWDADKYGPETWEKVLYVDSWARRRYLASVTAFHSNQQLNDPQLLTQAHKIVSTLLVEEEFRWLSHFNMLAADDFRSFGIIFGQFAGHLAKQKPATKAVKVQVVEAEAGLMFCWTHFKLLTPEDKEIGRLVEAKVNPYTGKAVSRKALKRAQVMLLKMSGKSVKLQ